MARAAAKIGSISSTSPFSTLSTWFMFTTTFFGLSGRPVRKDEPEPEAAGGDEEVQEDRANQVLRDINIYSMNKCKA